jgi:hypothetical protein
MGGVTDGVAFVNVGAKTPQSGGTARDMRYGGSDPDGIANILSLADAGKYSRVRYDSSQEKAFVMEKSDGTECRFIKTEHGMYYLNTAAMTGGASVDHGTALVVTVAAEAILGPNVDSLKSKVDLHGTNGDDNNSTYQSSDAETDFHNDLSDSDSQHDGATVAGVDEKDTDMANEAADYENGYESVSCYEAALSASDVEEAPGISISNDEDKAPIVSGYETANNAHDVDEGPISGEDPFDSDSHTDGATATGVDDIDESKTTINYNEDGPEMEDATEDGPKMEDANKDKLEMEDATEDGYETATVDDPDNPEDADDDGGDDGTNNAYADPADDALAADIDNALIPGVPDYHAPDAHDADATDAPIAGVYADANHDNNAGHIGVDNNANEHTNENENAAGVANDTATDNANAVEQAMNEKYGMRQSD